MKKLYLIIALVVLVGIGFYAWERNRTASLKQSNTPKDSGSVDLPSLYPDQTQIVAQNLDTPWEMVFLPDGSIFVTERKGTVRLIDPSGTLQENPIATISSVREIGEGGLLGMALHPEFAENNLLYLYYTYAGEGNNSLNRVVRMTYEKGSLQNEQIIVDAIPGAANHNGGRIAFGPDNYLYITTGDAQEPSLAQNTDSLAGKILRVTDEGEPAPGNPFQNEVYSYGHRNSQGLAWDSSGNLWSTEHGRSGILSGYDEVNLIVAGGNYGWPEYQGDEAAEGIIVPKKHSGATTTWAPGGVTMIDSTLYFVGLRGKSLYAASIQGTDLGDVIPIVGNDYGRLRIVHTSPEGVLYVATSNRDGRGVPQQNDDMIIMVGSDILSP